VQIFLDNYFRIGYNEWLIDGAGSASPLTGPSGPPAGAMQGDPSGQPRAIPARASAHGGKSKKGFSDAICHASRPSKCLPAKCL
jgi:hypothetical protein